MITDYHVHIGPFAGDLMFEPEDVARDMMSFGVDKWFYMSTAFPCVPANYIEWFRGCVVRMNAVAPGKGFPVLWMTEEMLLKSDYYMDNRYVGIKIHERYAALSPVALDSAFALAEEYGVPLWIHTGEFEQCCASRYDAWCSRYTGVRVVLSHGRPLDQAVQMLKQHDQVMLDSAFMSLEQMLFFAENGYAARVLFGSDYPIQRYFFSDSDIGELYTQHLKSAHNLCRCTKLGLWV
ncbi:MAG: amidohydrolase family protein [Akkermansia sp.]|nr:amidohydrolase family protein [Akkermansia sp.]